MSFIVKFRISADLRRSRQLKYIYRYAYHNQMLTGLLEFEIVTTKRWI